MIFVNVTNAEGEVVPVASTAIAAVVGAGDHCVLHLVSGHNLPMSASYGRDAAAVSAGIAQSVQRVMERNQRRRELTDLSGARSPL